MTGVTIVGIGNELRRDDGFGPVVVRELAARALPVGVHVADYGTRTVHLAFDLVAADGPVVLVDAMGRGERPGTVTLLAPELERLAVHAVSGHDLDLAGTLRMVERLGGALDDVLLLGCEPADVGDGIGLTATVADAVPVAVELLLDALPHLLDPGRRERRAVASHPIDRRRGPGLAGGHLPPGSCALPADARDMTD